MATVTFKIGTSKNLICIHVMALTLVIPFSTNVCFSFSGFSGYRSISFRGVLCPLDSLSCGFWVLALLLRLENELAGGPANLRSVQFFWRWQRLRQPQTRLELISIRWNRWEYSCKFHNPVAFINWVCLIHKNRSRIIWTFYSKWTRLKKFNSMSVFNWIIYCS